MSDQGPQIPRTTDLAVPVLDAEAGSWWPTSMLRLTHIPRAEEPSAQESDDPYERMRRGALVAANAAGTGAPVALTWSRRQAEADVAVHVGGFPSRRYGVTREHRPDGDGDGSYEFPYPVGSLGTPDDSPAWQGLAHWVSADVHLVPPQEEGAARPPQDSGSPLRLEDLFASVWQAPFAIVVAARPATSEEISVEMRAAEIMTRNPSGRGAAFDVDTAVAQRRYRELRQQHGEGLWHVVVAIGGQDHTELMAIASMVTSAVDLTDYDYQLRIGRQARDLNELLHRAWDERGQRPTVPSAVLARLARPPTIEIRGVQARRAAPFDITPERSGSVPIGIVLDAHHRPGGSLSVSHDTLNRHTFVCGATGSGKSRTVRGLLETVSTGPAPLPWLVIEPAKAEYARMAGRLDEAGVSGSVLQLRPGHVTSLAAGLNPLEPAALPDGRRFPLQTHLDLVRALFLAAFDAQEPFPQVLSAALTRCYSSYGWDLVTGRPQPGLHGAFYPTLGDLQRFAATVVTEIGYGQEVANNVRGFVDVRLNSLRLGTPGRFLEGAHPLDLDRLLQERAVIELEDVGDDQDKAFLMGILLIRIVEHLRLRMQGRESDVPLAHLLVIEEAHRLLRRGQDGTPANHAVELFAGLLAEIRAYGQGVVVVEQIPSKVIPDVIKNTALKIVHRLPASDDREAVGGTMNLSEDQSRFVVSLSPGQAAAFADGMDAPVLIQVPLGHADAESARGARSDLPCEDCAFRGCRSLCFANSPGCTVEDLEAARGLAADHDLVLWVETETIRRVIGDRPTPPPPGLAERLRRVHAADPRRLACAINQRVEESVHVRAPALARFYPPAQLIDHLTAALAQAVVVGAVGDPDETLRAGTYLAVPWLLQLVLHERLDERQWAALGVPAPSPGVDATPYLLTAVHQRTITDLTPILLYGAGADSTLERAIGSRRGDSGYAEQVTAALSLLSEPHMVINALTKNAT